MCGIFGIVLAPSTKFEHSEVAGCMRRLALYSESRGKDSSGVAFRNEITSSMDIIKGDVAISDLLHNPSYKKSLHDALVAYQKGSAFLAFGHARLVTNGSQLQEVNNQPVIKDGIIAVHNGIIVNAEELWQKNVHIKREYLIDTEIVNSLIRYYLSMNYSLTAACSLALTSLEGTYSLSLAFNDLAALILATNNGSLYYISDYQNYLVFASEGYFLKRLLTNTRSMISEKYPVINLSAGGALLVDLEKFSLHSLSIAKPDCNDEAIQKKQPFGINKILISNKNKKMETVIDPSIFNLKKRDSNLFRILEYYPKSIANLKRCTRCLLPVTFPFITFDKTGVCNYCKHYIPRNNPKPIEELISLVEPYKRSDGKHDCIIPFSGGRDSTYALHIAKTILGLNPIAYTYDWGMVTDLARRNIARVCGKLGVEHLIVAADIQWKRANIRKNISAWLKNPNLGMIPLFMAGDKFFFYYTNRVKKQTDIRLNIWGINYLENTEFKTGFAGLAPEFDKERIYSLSIINQFKLFKFVAGNVIKSPAYLNQSVWDSLGSFASRYIAPKRDYYHLFDYYKWDENEIADLIQHEYNWEKAIDTAATWRIGDGTASFYNYIYTTVAGFCENDTFRSNQIREGMIDRSTALRLVLEENKPRYETLRWYLEIIGLDFRTVINAINRIPKLYSIESDR